MILRRDFLVGLIGTAAATTVSQGLPLLDATQPNALALRLAHDPLRPQYHLLPAANWMNDPNGPIYWNQRYHMFYQYNPHAAIWGDMHWGHAVSTDMVHWKHLSVAMAPTPGGPDADGCFTGTAAVQDGQVVMLYTGVRAATARQATIKDGNPPLLETQCLATSADPELRSWTKLPAPIIASPPPGMEVNGFRDPSPWRQGDWWYAVLATGVANQGGAVLLYRSKDLRAWEYMHILSGRAGGGVDAAVPFDPWEVWECPEFFALGGKHVLIFSTAGKGYWQIGALDPQTMKFSPEQTGILDYGSFYAPKTQLDEYGNRILWGWITEARKEEDYKAAGWAGMMSLPRVLAVGGDGRLHFSVAKQLNELRGAVQALHATADEKENLRRIHAMRVKECCGEILCVARRGANPFELAFCGAAEDATAWLTLRYDPLHPGQVFVDERPLPLSLGQHEDLELHAYIDGSVIELLVNGQKAMTRRFYYIGSSPRDVRMQWTGKATEIISLSVWQLKPISPDRLTS